MQDMNGIIHNCSHADGISEALSMDAMMDKIFLYLDRCVVDLIKPKKLLYLAIDGCAPRAKMNQQRARRFRARQEMYVLQVCIFD
jgi:5'-3' exonuclease